MSNTSFVIDAVPTPKFHLLEAFRQDMEYYMGSKKWPPAGRSAIEREQEKLNSYMQYVNEQFIQEGFSSSNITNIIAQDTVVAGYSNNGRFTLSQSEGQGASVTVSPASKADIHIVFTLCGEYTPPDPAPIAPATLAVTALLNGSTHAIWRQAMVPGYNVISIATIAAGRAKGSYNTVLRLSLSAGSMVVETGAHTAASWGHIVKS